MTTQEIADRLVALCREGKYEQVYDELFAADAENIEMPQVSGGPLGNVKGLDAIRRKGELWAEGIVDMHGGSVGEPIVAGSWFALPMSLDVTFKDRGRVAMEELCVYRVRDGKIASEQFFYDA